MLSAGRRKQGLHYIRRAMNESMQSTFKLLIRSAAVALVLGTALPHGAFAVGTEPVTEPLSDPTPCFAAIAANDAGEILSLCGALIDNAKTSTADRLKALIARAGAYSAKDMIDRAIGDYDMALRLDATLADIFNARGELWRRKGDRRRAVADFGAALKLNPRHEAARANYRSLALELERIGALLVVDGKPSFNCATARHAAEKTICANPELANLDREITAANARVVRKANEETSRAGAALQREQDEFIAHRNATFGRAGYDLQNAMRERLDQLKAIIRNQGAAPASFDLK
jgi:tetratricopeptide (TPR) repeat protein